MKTSSIDDYEIIKILDEGAYGVVKLAKHKEVGVPVALKIVDGNLLEKVGKIRHVMREKDLLYSLNHFHIVKLYENFHDPETNKLYFVFEICQYGNLENLINLLKVVKN